MASGNNRRRTTRTTKDRQLWGNLFDKNADAGQDINSTSFYQDPPEEPAPPAPGEPQLRRSPWADFNIWTLCATSIFLIFAGILYWLVISMWVPQDLKDIAGYTDKGAARDLTALLRNANGGEVVFTEAEINRYLRDTCRMRQSGIMAIISHSEGVAMRIHNGYCEIIIDRIIGSNLHQTTSVFITFRRVNEHGRQVVRADFSGGEPMLGSTPRGGRIGCVDLPQHCMRMLQPSVETLQACYADFFEIIRERGYFPTFTKGANGQDSTVRLSPVNSY